MKQVTPQPSSVVILGGTTGLGREIAVEYLNRGSRVVVIGRSAREDKSCPAYTQVRCDLNVENEVEGLIQWLHEQNSQRNLHTFIWCAGKALMGEFSKQSPGVILETFMVNIAHSSLVAHAMWQIMQENGNGCFSTIASSSGVTPRVNEAVYAATKHAQVGFTRSLGLENSEPGVKVSLFLPGGMKTPFWDGISVKDFDSFLPPHMVASHIVGKIMHQTEGFMEVPIPRGSF